MMMIRGEDTLFFQSSQTVASSKHKQIRASPNELLECLVVSDAGDLGLGKSAHQKRLNTLNTTGLFKCRPSSNVCHV